MSLTTPAARVMLNELVLDALPPQHAALRDQCQLLPIIPMATGQQKLAT
ncbi:hypothetical protein SNOG_03423 [Parastagonospora nodorum SN15]|uniref:Uncharacterized protein n=1 Tax=Phaeosphaeria nodorum (strain SN15 / ATCC MYA-4574 / FGSC 10173) TaxID=321614 RepID=Q0UXU1_PHANO|nr:hypothetical protein SNOG_03423 [Parastagonospora nodorum SN15]EAT88628.1 hypothetical protein SNOG_03423 [Parastagonospora nodorum SN15]